jgi:hypothetical protein
MLVTIGKNLGTLNLVRASAPSTLNPLLFDRQLYPLAVSLGSRILTELRRGVRNQQATGFSYEQYSLTCLTKQWYL